MICKLPNVSSSVMSNVISLSKPQVCLYSAFKGCGHFRPVFLLSTGFSNVNGQGVINPIAFKFLYSNIRVCFLFVKFRSYSWVNKIWSIRFLCQDKINSFDVGNVGRVNPQVLNSLETHKAFFYIANIVKIHVLLQCTQTVRLKAGGHFEARQCQPSLSARFALCLVRRRHYFFFFNCCHYLG